MNFSKNVWLGLILSLVILPVKTYAISCHDALRRADAMLDNYMDSSSASKSRPMTPKELRQYNAEIASARDRELALERERELALRARTKNAAATFRKTLDEQRKVPLLGLTPESQATIKLKTAVDQAGKLSTVDSHLVPDGVQNLWLYQLTPNDTARRSLVGADGQFQPANRAKALDTLWAIDSLLKMSTQIPQESTHGRASKTLSETQRLSEAEKILGRKFSDMQKKAILSAAAAHNEAESKGVGDWKRVYSQISELQKGGFTPQETFFIIHSTLTNETIKLANLKIRDRKITKLMKRLIYNPFDSDQKYPSFMADNRNKWAMAGVLSPALMFAILCAFAELDCSIGG